MPFARTMSKRAQTGGLFGIVDIASTVHALTNGSDRMYIVQSVGMIFVKFSGDDV